MDVVALGASPESKPTGATQTKPLGFKPLAGVPQSATKSAAGTGHSVVVERCQVCDAPELEPVLFLGYLPPVNTMPPIGARPGEQPAYPAQVLRCTRCSLVQLGLVVDPAILFPPTYPYTSGTTRVLRENFKELAREVASLYPLSNTDLVVDIGSNDGTLLSNFAPRGPVLGIEPTNAGKLAIERGIPTYISFFNRSTVKRVTAEEGHAKLVTATNVFAHIENVHEVVASVLDLMTGDGIFVTESHYLLPLVRTMQYDTIYHEHLRYYSLASLRNLFAMHGMEVIHAKAIETHGGSIRVYAARQGTYPVRETVQQMLDVEAAELTPERLSVFARDVVLSKLGLCALLRDIKAKGQRIYGIGAPSRASTLINYVGIDAAVIDCVLEIAGSHKIGKYMPGTLIPVLEESKLFEDPPEYALLLSWHIAEELMPKLRQRGFKGKFIIPLPEPRVV
jgi:hypothetical protein